MSCAWLCPLSTEVAGSRPMRAVPISCTHAPGGFSWEYSLRTFEQPAATSMARGFAYDRKSFGREVGERRTFGKPLAELDGLGAQSFVAQCLQRCLERSRLAHRRLVAFDDAVIATAKESRQKIEHLENPCEKLQAGQPLTLVRRAAGPVFYG